MKLRDMSNKDISTLTTCESEPIHVPGSIQPHGVLLAIGGEINIRFCSANCRETFALPPSAVLQKPLSGLNEDLAQKIAIVRGEERVPVKPFFLAMQQKQWDVHRRPAQDIAVV